MRPDVYYGAIAENYESSRSVKSKWKEEQAAFAEFLTDGPVLDVPFGTGRFVPIYRAKKLSFTGIDISTDMLAVARRTYPGIEPVLGSAFDLRYGDNEFATAVCVRFLEWLPLERAKTVLDRLRKIAAQLIVTINHGVEGKPEAYTYDLGKFLGAIDGLLIDGRRVTANIPGITSEMFKLRPARWSDVVDQFQEHGDAAEANIQRIADKHCSLIGLPSIYVRSDRVKVRAEYWSGNRIASIVETLCSFDDSFRANDVPRRYDRPITVLAGNGPDLILDGRKRAAQWMRQPGPHPVLVLR